MKERWFSRATAWVVAASMSLLFAAPLSAQYRAGSFARFHQVNDYGRRTQAREQANWFRPPVVARQVNHVSEVADLQEPCQE